MSPEDVDPARLAEAYRSLTVSEAAQQLGITVRKLFRLLDRHGIPRRGHISSFGSVLTYDYLAARAEDSHAEIARDVGCAPETVRDWRIRHGLDTPLDAAKADRACRLYTEAQASRSTVAARLGCSQRQAGRLLDQADVIIWPVAREAMTERPRNWRDGCTARG